MACLTPLGLAKDTFGIPRVHASRKEAALADGEYSEARCGQCPGCKADRARDWAIRCYCETHTPSGLVKKRACMITLTYRDEELPEHGSLHPPHVTDFWKRLRRRCGPIRYLQCGEYGSTTKRPHHHAIVWGSDFREDRRLWQQVGSQRTYVSETLAEAWRHGFVTVSPATFATASYVAGYVTKKLRDQEWRESADIYDWDGGRIVATMVPPYITMSRAPGIGRRFFEEYWRDIYPSDYITIQGRQFLPPYRFDRWLEEEQPTVYDQVIQKRREWSASQGMTTDRKSQAKLAIFKKNQETKHKRSKV